MANLKENNPLPNPENPSNEFTLELRNSDRIYRLLKDKQFQQGWEVLDDKKHCADVIGEIVSSDNLFKVIYIDIRGLDGNGSIYQDYNLHLNFYRQVKLCNDDRYDNPIDESKRYFTEDKAQELMKRLSSFGMSTSYKRYDELRYIEIENKNQKYIFSCGPSSLAEALIINNNNKYRTTKFKNVEELLKDRMSYFPWFDFYIENTSINSLYLYDQYIQLTTQQRFEESITGFVQTGEKLINILYQMYNEHPFVSKLVLDYPDHFYNGKGMVGTYRRHQISKSSVETEIYNQPEINSKKNQEYSDSFNIGSAVENVTFDSIAGQARAVGEAKKLVLAINHPEVYKRRGVNIPKGILFYGPKGTGKTLIAKAIASEVNAELFEVSCSDIDTKWYGESGRNMQAIFDKANEVTKTGKKAIILFDEIDAIAPSRTKSYEASVKTVSILLQNIDGFRSNKDVLIIGTTNLPENIDDALKRPGRIDKIILVEIPNLEDRKAILVLHINKAKKNASESHDLFSSNLDVQKIAESTDGMSGADLANIINLALETKTVQETEGVRWVPVNNTDIERTLIEFDLKKKEKNKIGF